MSILRSALTSGSYVAALGPGDMPIVGHWGQFAPTASVPKVLDELYTMTDKVLKTAAA
jgi:hypothetical protein